MRVESVKWELVSSDNTGSFIQVDFVCPGCNLRVFDVLFTSKTKEDLKWGFEVDYKCEICGEDLVLMCYAN